MGGDRVFMHHCHCSDCRKSQGLPAFDANPSGLEAQAFEAAAFVGIPAS